MMKALILNSGTGSRMGDMTKTHPKCMTPITDTDTILSRQLTQLEQYDLEIVITTGGFHHAIVEYCNGLSLKNPCKFVKNPMFDTTNYIYSIYNARDFLKDDILLLHGDLVFEDEVLARVMEHPSSCMVTSSTVPLPEKDFKAVIVDGRIQEIGIHCFDNAQSAQPLYKLQKDTWQVWLQEMVAFCQQGETKCYGENAFNEVWENCPIYPLDVVDKLCGEIDTPEDLVVMKGRLQSFSRMPLATPIKV